MTRTDVHRPSAINPSEYTEIAYLPHGGDLGLAEYRIKSFNIVMEHMKKTGGNWSDHEHGGSCEICGNTQAETFVVFYHQPTNTYIRAGSTCAEKVDLEFNRNAFTHYVKGALDARKRQAGKAKAQTLLADYGLTEAWTIYTRLSDGEQADWAATWKGATDSDRFIFDLVEKFIKYGSLSEKQIAWLRRLIAEIPARAARKAQWEAEDARRREISQHVGGVGARLEFVATIRFSKYFETPDNQFSGGYTLTVLDDENGNVLVWTGKGFDSPKGAKIRFKATVKDHTERDGVKQTKITRAKLLSVITVAEASPDAQDARQSVVGAHGSTWATPQTEGATA